MLDVGHILAIGPTRVGKSNFLVHWMLKQMSLKRGMTLVLPHWPPAEQAIAEIYARLKDRVLGRLIVEDAGYFDEVPMREFIQSSAEVNPFNQMRDDRQFAERAKEAPLSRLKEKKLSETQEKENSVNVAYSVFQDANRNGAGIPDSDIPFVIARWHPAFAKARRFCTDLNNQRELDRMADLPQREYGTMVATAITFLKAVYRSPVVIARTSKPATFDWNTFFRNGGIHIITKGKASKDDFQTLVQADFAMKFRSAMDGTLGPHRYCTDELNNYSLCSNLMAESLSTSGYRDFYQFHCVQLLDYPSDEIRSNVLSNMIFAIFQQQDPDTADYFAKALRGLLDKHQVHHTEFTTRMVHAGYEDIERVSVGKSSKGGSSETKSVQSRPVYRPEIDARNVYDPLQSQEIWNARRLSETPVGSFWLSRRGTKPELVNVPLVRPSFFPHTVPQKVAECLSLIRSQAPYETPVWNPEITPAAEPKAKSAGDRARGRAGTK